MTDTDRRKLAVETDHQITALYEEMGRLNQRHIGQYSAVHHVVGDRRQGYSREWTLTNEQARDKAIIRIRLDQDPSGQIKAVLNKLGDIEAEINATAERITVLDEIWQQHGWNRYFLVTNSNGHIHRWQNCSTCFPTTQYRWLVELADCDENAMIAEFGEKACTVCFPTAPANPKFHGPGRRDAEAQATKAAEKAAREAVKAAKNLTKAEQFKDHNGWWVTTVAACKQALRDEIEFKYYYGHGPHPYYPAAVEAAKTAREVLLNRGVTTAELDKIVASAEKKYSKF